MIEYIVGTLGAALLTVFGWAFQINSRVSVLENQHDELLKFIETKFDVVNAKFDVGVNRRLDRIERALNGALHGSEG